MPKENAAASTGLRQYLLAQLLWNPEIDAQACMREFLIGYFGMAAPWIEKWIEACQSRITPEIHMSIYDSPAAAYLEEALLEEGDRIFDCAELRPTMRKSFPGSVLQDFHCATYV